MSKASLVLLLAISLAILLPNHVSAQPSDRPTFEYEFCRNEKFGNYTTNSTYEDNLITVLSTLQKHASSETFYNTSAGNGTDTVHAQFYCRGDINSSFCSACVFAAALNAVNCSNARAGIIWYDQCTLRYKNESMYGVAEDKLVLYSRLPSNLTNPNEFWVVLNDTVSSLIQEAAHGNGPSFAIGQREVSAFMTAYFLVQCSPDIQETCESCLLSAFNTTRTCCGEWPTLLYTFAPSCQVMYDTTGIFYIDPNAPPSPPSSTPSTTPLVGDVTPPPPQVTVLHTPSAGMSAMIKCCEGMKLGIITTALVFFGLVFA